MKTERGKVWLGVSGLVENHLGEWLVVKKRYSGLKGKWSFPAGFVKEGETIDDAIIREVLEETGIECKVVGLIGFRTGVLQHVVSDNMAIFHLIPVDQEQAIQMQEKELSDVQWISPALLKEEENVSVMLIELADRGIPNKMDALEDINPGEVFGYTNYKLFLG